MVERGVAEAEARPAVRQSATGDGGDHPLAEDRLIMVAVVALPAVRAPRAHHAVTGPNPRHVPAHRLDPAGALVAEDDRKWEGERAAHHLEIGVAEAARAQLD